jgi:hypothetical protein
MLNRRRRPILGAAILVGASSAAAKHEAKKQSALEAQYEADVEREIERRQREEANKQRQTQRAVDEAMAKAGLNNSRTTVVPQASQNLQIPQQPALYQTQQSPPPPPSSLQLPPAGLPGVFSSDAHSQATMFSPSAQTSPYMVPPPRPRSAGVPGTVESPGAKCRYCSRCGHLCQQADNFCGVCGLKQASQ